MGETRLIACFCARPARPSKPCLAAKHTHRSFIYPDPTPPLWKPMLARSAALRRLGLAATQSAQQLGTSLSSQGLPAAAAGPSPACICLPALAVQSCTAYRLIASLAPLSAALGHFWQPCLGGAALGPQPGYLAAASLLPQAQAQQLQQQRGFLNDSDISKKYHERRLIGYSQQQIFDVVTQIQNYKEFVPWCVSSNITTARPPDFVEAELEVGFKMFTERYTSQVRCEPPSRVITSVHDSTLFSHMDSTWDFQPGPLPNSCWLSFSVDFAFRSPLYRSVASVFFNEVVKRMMCAFEVRCQTLYGDSALVRKPPPGQQRAAKLNA